MIRTSNKDSRSRGFTLLEILVSLGLIATALLAVFRLQGQNLDLQSEARFVTMATQLAQDRFSDVLARPTLNSGSSTGEFGDLFPHYFYREEIVEVPDMVNLFRVRIWIHLDVPGRAKEQIFETYIFRHQEIEG